LLRFNNDWEGFAPKNALWLKNGWIIPIMGLHLGD
jgi:hypothetical protein